MPARTGVTQEQTAEQQRVQQAERQGMRGSRATERTNGHAGSEYQRDVALGKMPLTKNGVRTAL